MNIFEKPVTPITEANRRWFEEYEAYSHYDLNKLRKQIPEKMKEVISIYLNNLCHEKHNLFDQMFYALPDDPAEDDAGYRVRKDDFLRSVYDFFEMWLMVQYGAPVQHPEAVLGLWNAGLIPSTEGIVRPIERSNT